MKELKFHNKVNEMKRHNVLVVYINVIDIELHDIKRGQS